MPHPWPLFDLRLRTPRLELRVPTDEDLLELLAVARAGLHDPVVSPFLVPWDELPSPAFERQFLLHWWQVRGSWRPDDWNLTFTAVFEGRPVGVQDLFARDFAHRRSVSTGSGLPVTSRAVDWERRCAQPRSRSPSKDWARWSPSRATSCQAAPPRPSRRSSATGPTASGSSRPRASRSSSNWSA